MKWDSNNFSGEDSAKKREGRKNRTAILHVSVHVSSQPRNGVKVLTFYGTIQLHTLGISARPKHPLLHGIFYCSLCHCSSFLSASTNPSHPHHHNSEHHPIHTLLILLRSSLSVLRKLAPCPGKVRPLARPAPLL
jgi:hypothetical protein